MQIKHRKDEIDVADRKKKYHVGVFFLLEKIKSIFNKLEYIDLRASWCNFAQKIR